MSTTKNTYIVYCNTHGPVETKSLTYTTLCPYNEFDRTRFTVLKNSNTPKSALSGVVVDPDEKKGNYTSIAEAFSDGNTDVFVRNGTYVETSDIVVPNHGKLTGQTSGGVVIVLAAGARIVVDGSGGVKETAGTVSTTNNSNAVTGIGTSFTNLSVGNFILLGNTYYQINGITDDTNLSLLVPFQGRSMTDQSYCAQAMVTGVVIQNIVATQSTGNNIFFRAARFSHVSEFAITKGNTNLQIADCGDCSFSRFSTTNSSAGAGVSVENSVDLSFQSVNVINNAGNGIEIVNGCSNINFTSCYSSCNNNHGIYVDNSQLIHLTKCTVKQNNQTGIDVRNGSSNVDMNNCNMTENTLGANVASAYNTLNHNVVYNNTAGVAVTTNCVVSDNTVRNNTNDGINVAGNDNVLSNNNIHGNNNGIYIQGNDNVVDGNRCYANANNGLEIAAISDTNIVYYNHLSGNAGTNFQNGSGTTVVVDVSNNNVV